MGIQYYKKQRAPKYTDKQLEEIPTRAQRLYHMLSNNDFEFIMDDEKYFLLQDQSVPTNRGSYTSDKPSSHYGHNVLQYLDPNDVQFVHKEFNPQNCPQTRPIETLGSILKNTVYNEGWEAKTINQLRRRIGWR
ncbi:unnamed protein product, partial [Rotaria magnacalcarata]